MGLALSPQDQHTLLRGLPQHRADHLTGVVTQLKAKAQRTLDQLIAQRELMVQNGPPQDRKRALHDIAWLRSNAYRRASTWHTSLPTSNSLKVSSKEFRTSIRLRLSVSMLHQIPECRAILLPQVF